MGSLQLSVTAILCTHDVFLENKNHHVQMGVAADMVLQDNIHWKNTQLKQKMLIIRLYKVVLTFESVDETMKLH